MVLLCCLQLASRSSFSLATRDSNDLLTRISSAEVSFESVPGPRCKLVSTTVCLHAYIAQPTLGCCMQMSMGDLRQELHAFKQLSSSRSGSSPQQQLSGPFLHGPAAGELLDPLHGFPVRLSTPTRRSTMACSEASGMRQAYDVAATTMLPQLRHASWQQHTVWCSACKFAISVGEHGPHGCCAGQQSPCLERVCVLLYLQPPGGQASGCACSSQHGMPAA